MLTMLTQSDEAYTASSSFTEASDVTERTSSPSKVMKVIDEVSRLLNKDDHLLFSNDPCLSFSVKSLPWRTLFYAIGTPSVTDGKATHLSIGFELEDYSGKYLDRRVNAMFTLILPGTAAYTGPLNAFTNVDVDLYLYEYGETVLVSLTLPVGEFSGLFSLAMEKAVAVASGDIEGTNGVPAKVPHEVAEVCSRLLDEALEGLVKLGIL